MSSVGNSCLIVLAGYREMQRSNDTAFLFEQEANFWYLSGIEAPDWRIIIDGTRRRSYAVAPTTSDTRQIFDGVLSFEKAKQVSGVDEVITQDEADSLLMQLRRDHPLVYMVEESPVVKQYCEFVCNSAQSDLKEYLSHRFTHVRDCRSDVAKLRALKQPIEVEAIQKAIDMTIVGFDNVRTEISSYNYEYEAEARLSYDFRRQGAAVHAYNPIVGDNHNACTLHYVQNHDQLTRPSLLLIDAGAKYHGYCADITRTFAVGEISERQRHIYEAVRDIQKRCIDLVLPGMPLKNLQEKAEQFTEEALKQLGLYEDEKSVGRYFPHAVSHSLGIDVHDTFGGYGSLVEGMVLTVEPGIYVSQESIGVRIEDNVLVTRNGCQVLSDTLSREL